MSLTQRPTHHPRSSLRRPPLLVVLPKDRPLFLRPFLCVIVSWSTGNSYLDPETTHRKEEGDVCVPWGRLWKGSDRKDDAMIMMWLRMTQWTREERNRKKICCLSDPRQFAVKELSSSFHPRYLLLLLWFFTIKFTYWQQYLWAFQFELLMDLQWNKNNAWMKNLPLFNVRFLSEWRKQGKLPTLNYECTLISNYILQQQHPPTRSHNMQISVILG